MWFYDMQADGFSLDDKRSPIEANDIPDIIHRFRHLDDEATRTRRDRSFLVPVDEIRQKDYDLSINKYKEVERKQVVYEDPKLILARIEKLEKEICEGIEKFRNEFLEEEGV